MKSKRQWMATNRIKTRAPLHSLFPVDPQMVDAIAEHMQENGYEETQPIVLWDLTDQENSNHALYVVDGHTRLQASKKAKLSPVYVARMTFQDNDDALQYAIHNQRDRRNLTDADLFRCIEAVDKRKQRGGDRKSEQVKSKTSIEAIDSVSSAEETARIVGTSKAKVERARSVLDHGDEETKEQVLRGEKSIHRAYTEIKAGNVSDDDQKLLADAIAENVASGKSATRVGSRVETAVKKRRKQAGKSFPKEIKTNLERLKNTTLSCAEGLTFLADGTIKPESEDDNTCFQIIRRALPTIILQAHRLGIDILSIYELATAPQPDEPKRLN